jgi:hypothetical protein
MPALHKKEGIFLAKDAKTRSATAFLKGFSLRLWAFARAPVRHSSTFCPSKSCRREGEDRMPLNRGIGGQSATAQRYIAAANGQKMPGPP